MTGKARMRDAALLCVLSFLGCAPARQGQGNSEPVVGQEFSVLEAGRTTELWRYLSSCRSDPTSAGLTPAWTPAARHAERARLAFRAAYQQLAWGSAPPRAVDEYFLWLLGALDNGAPGVLVVAIRAEALDRLRVVDWPRDTVGKPAFPNWRVEPVIPCPGGQDVIRAFLDTTGTLRRPLRFDGGG